ncbi:MAG: leucine-rich repeat domain-containing protein [Deltaproteobacteria bacterium]|nr:leucine-rich repeat domain-containing protein [Deltaproteobacteria bacterium]
MNCRILLTIVSLMILLFVYLPAYAGQWGDFAYTESEGTITITGYSCPEGVAVIPRLIDNKPVVGIGYEAFINCTGLTSVTIPGSVTTIAQRAFFGCAGLANVVIPNSVRHIGHHAFYGCTALTSSPVRPPATLVITHRLD